MDKERIQRDPRHELNDDDKTHIMEVFFHDLVPKLDRHQARIGTLSCAFAGEKYKNWTVEFRLRGSDFQIVGFEYDEDARHVNLGP